MNKIFSFSRFSIAALMTLGVTTSVALAAEDNGNDTAIAYTAQILRVDSEDIEGGIAELEAAGVKVLYNRGDLVLTFIPQTEVGEEVAAQNSKGAAGRNARRRKPRKFDSVRPEPGRNFLTMDSARTMFDAYRIYEPNSVTDLVLNGSGVVVGFSDTGFDPTHINFLTSDGKSSRVKMAVQYNETEGRRDVYTSTKDIYEWRTDRSDAYHATHVAGILTGAYSHDGLQGMAPGADIVATTSTLTDVGILCGVEDVIAYAKSVGKPAVVNLSVGNNNGPHDGTSLFCQYLDRCAEDAIICISAGNEGDGNGHMSYTATEEAPQFLFRVGNWASLEMYGQTDIYSDDSRPFQFELFVKDGTKSYTIADSFSSGVIDFAQNPEYVITSDPTIDDPAFHYDEEFAKYYTGEVYLYGENDPESGRYHVMMYYDCTTDIKVSDTKQWARYVMGGRVTGSDGQHFNLFADGSYSWFMTLNNYPLRPDNEMSISDLATGHKTISVGMYHSRLGVERLDGDMSWGGKKYSIHNSSSYGTLLDGRVLPLTVAPGGLTVSSMSSACIEDYHDAAVAMSSFKTKPIYDQVSDEDNDRIDEADDGVMEYAVSASEDADNVQLYDPEKEYYWRPEGGTSMASPYAAGVIATWLQADPKLNWMDVQKIILATNESEVHTAISNPRHGMGYLRPYEGLQEVMKGISSKVEECIGRSVFASVEADNLVILNPDCRNLTVDFYAIDGRRLGSIAAGSEARCELSLSELPTGMMICRISAVGSSVQSLKIMR